jgi:hypothetical protein
MQWSAVSPPLINVPLSPWTNYLDCHLVSKGEERVIYRISLVDVKTTPSDHTKVCAVLLVPQGREHEYLFGDHEGRRKLAKDSGYARMVFVCRERGAGNVEFEALKSEISEFMLDLLPRGFTEIKLPFISVAHSIGVREIVFEDQSVIVEDVQVEEKQEFWERRLLFRSNLNLLQSEIRVDLNKTFMFGYLPCGYQKAIFASLGFLDRSEEDSALRGVVVGLGGGVLASFFAHYLVNAELDVVELDQSVAVIAQKYFGFQTSNAVRLHIMDGLEYIRNESTLTNPKRHFVIIDVNTNDSSLAMSCPPAPFVEQSFLTAMKEIILPGGLCIVNVVTRSGKIREEIRESLENVFGKLVYEIRIAEDVNRVFVAVNLPHPINYEIDNFDALFENVPEISSDGLDPDLFAEIEEMLQTVSFPELLSKAEKERLRKKAQKMKKKKSTKKK